MLLAAVRVAPRLVRDIGWPFTSQGGSAVLIVGANDAGEALASQRPD